MPCRPSQVPKFQTLLSANNNLRFSYVCEQLYPTSKHCTPETYSPISITVQSSLKTRASVPLSPNANTSWTQFCTTSQVCKQLWMVSKLFSKSSSGKKTRSTDLLIRRRDSYHLSVACQLKSYPKYFATVSHNLGVPIIYKPHQS